MTPLDIVNNCRKIDDTWIYNYKLLSNFYKHIHPDFYALCESNLTTEEIIQKLDSYKPTIYDPISDIDKLKILYENIIQNKTNDASIEDMLYTIQVSFNLSESISDCIYYPDEIEQDRESPFTFDEVISLIKNGVLK